MSPVKHPIRKGGRGPRAASVVALLISLLLPLTFSSTANAGLMKHWVCAVPDSAGNLISTTNNTEGWHFSSAIAGGIPQPNCSSFTSLGLRMDATSVQPFAANSGRMWWMYQAPPGTQVLEAHLVLAGELWGGADDNAHTAIFTYRDAPQFDGGHVLSGCERYYGCTFVNDWIHQPVNATTWWATWGCGGGGTCGGGRRGYLIVSHGYMFLSDDNNPSLGSVTGTVLSAGPVSGQRNLVFAANDYGVGVAEVEVKIGGVTVLPRQILDSNNGRCVPQNGAYLYPQPCRTTVNGNVAVDTTKVPDGNHPLTATVWDAAGNSTVVVNREISVDNVPPPVNAVRPTVTDSGSGYLVGETVTADPGRWVGANVKTALQWQRSADGVTWKDIPYETKSTYRLSDGDTDHYVRIVVTATNSEGSSVAIERSSVKVRQRGASVGGVPGPGGSDPNAPSGDGPVELKVQGPNGSGGQLSSGRLLLSSKSGKRRASAGKTITIKGRLIDAGRKPIVGAQVDVFQTTALPGAQRSKVGQVITDNNGDYAYKVRALTNSRLELAYSAKENSVDYVDRQTVDLRVTATIKLKVKRTLRAHTKMKIEGRLIGGPLPARGATILFRAYDSKTGRFRPAGEVQTRPNGRFRYLRKLDYRGRYRFRAELVPTKDVPLIKAFSAHKDVVVR